MTTATPINSQQTVELAPSYTLPIVLVLGAIPLVLLQPWLSLAIAIFGLFLLFQTTTIRLIFTETTLEVYRSDKMIRSFPYREWQNWRIFWPGVPILFYFKEVKSIHFVPVLFDPKMLQACLEQRCPKQD